MLRAGASNQTLGLVHLFQNSLTFYYLRFSHATHFFKLIDAVFRHYKRNTLCNRRYIVLGNQLAL